MLSNGLPQELDLPSLEVHGGIRVISLLLVPSSTGGLYWFQSAALDKGHTGNVRFLTFAELLSDMYMDERRRSVARQSLVTKMLVVSGGDGYEEITPTDQSRESVGFNDSINHLLVWKM